MAVATRAMTASVRDATHACVSDKRVRVLMWCAVMDPCPDLTVGRGAPAYAPPSSAGGAGVGKGLFVSPPPSILRRHAAAAAAAAASASGAHSSAAATAVDAARLTVPPTKHHKRVPGGSDSVAKTASTAGTAIRRRLCLAWLRPSRCVLRSCRFVPTLSSFRALAARGIRRCVCILVLWIALLVSRFHFPTPPPHRLRVLICIADFNGFVLARVCAVFQQQTHLPVAPRTRSRRLPRVGCPGEVTLGRSSFRSTPR